MTNQQQTTNSVLVYNLFIFCKYTSESANNNGGAAETVSFSNTVYLAVSQERKSIKTIPKSRECMLPQINQSLLNNRVYTCINLACNSY